MSDDGAADDGDVSLTEGGEPPHLVARTCPYCLSPFAAGARAVVCPACGTPHHADCWQENGGCTTYGCTQAPGHRSPAGASPPAEETLLVGSSVPLPGRRQWLPTVFGRRLEDMDFVADSAAVLSMIGGFGCVHYALSPLLVLCVLGILRGRRALSMLRASGLEHDDAESTSRWRPVSVKRRARVAVVAGIFFIIVAAVNYAAELTPWGPSDAG